MAWPSSGDVDTTKFDQDTDKISESRPELEKMAGYINDIIDSGPISNSFSTISANGTSVVADSSSDTLILVAGNNISITANAGTDTITIASTASGGGNPLTADLDVDGFAIFDSNDNTVTVNDGLLATGVVTARSFVASQGPLEFDTLSEGTAMIQGDASISVPAIALTNTAGTDPNFFSITGFATASAGSRTLEGYLVVSIDGNTRYLPFYS